MAVRPIDVWEQPAFSAGLGQEIWQMNASGNAAFADLYDAAYRQATARGLSPALAQDAAMQAAKGSISSRHAMPDVWGDGRTIDLGGGLQKPVYPGPPAWGFDGGSGLDPETARRARMTENLLVEARNQRLNPPIAGLMPQPVVARLNPPAPPIQGRAIGVDDGLGFDPLAFGGGTTGANAAKIEATLSGMQAQPQQQNSGGPGLNILDAGMVAADLAANTLPMTQGPVAAPDVAQAAVQRSAATRLGDVNLDVTGAPRPQAGYSFSVDEPLNLSGGGPGTSTAKGEATIARQTATRAARDKDSLLEAVRRGRQARSGAAAAGAGKNFLGMVDDFIATPGHSIGHAAETGLKGASASLAQSMPKVGGMLGRLAPAARWAAPVGMFAATTGIPAVMGAMEGNEKAGVGGAALQGGSALAGAAIGQALIPIPVVGAGIGAMVGNALGSGLTSGAQALAEKGQEGDTGLMGNIGRVLDPFVDTAYEREQKALEQKMNSPAMRAIAQQEETRRLQAANQQREQVLMQAAMQGLL